MADSPAVQEQREREKRQREATAEVRAIMSRPQSVRLNRALQGISNAAFSGNSVGNSILRDVSSAGIQAIVGSKTVQNGLSSLIGLIGPAAGSFLGPIGSIAGAALGSLFGSLFSGKAKQQFPIPTRQPDRFMAIQFVVPGVGPEHFVNVDTCETARWSHTGNSYKVSGTLDPDN